MADIRISNLPTYTGDTTGAYLVMNDSGNTETFKVLKENIVSGVNYADLTQIPQQMIWNGSNVGNSGYKVAGGLMYNYTTSNLSVVNETIYLNTIILEPGETLDAIDFNISSLSVAGTMDIGLYKLTGLLNDGYYGYRVGELVHTITTGYTISSNGDKVISSINYTATQGTTPNNVYAVCIFINGGTYNLQKLSSNNLIPHVMGGNLLFGTFYRSMAQKINGLTSGTIVSDLSAYDITTDTSPGWLFTYRVI